MKLSPEGARWFVRLRWLACVAVFSATWLTSAVLDVVPNPLPMYAVGCAMVGYNLMFHLNQQNWPAGERNLERNILVQIAFDLVALTLLLYFSDLSRNPFLFFFVFHMIIGSMYLHGWAPHLLAGMAIALVGSVMLLEALGWIPVFPLQFPSDPELPETRPTDGLYLTCVFVAFASALWITVYFTTSIHRYVDRAHAEIRQ